MTFIITPDGRRINAATIQCYWISVKSVYISSTCPHVSSSQVRFDTMEEAVKWVANLDSIVGTKK